MYMFWMKTEIDLRATSNDDDGRRVLRHCFANSFVARLRKLNVKL